jgi:2-isopropylmalate synthase
VTRIAVYDTTLRDGMQGHGMSLSVEEKVRVAHVLDDLGIPFIEAGFPASNPKEAELFARLAHEGVRADVCAFGMTRRRDTRPQDDPALRALADSFAPVCTLVGKTWSLHLEKVVKVGRDENLAMIADSVAFLLDQGKRVIYDAEHFFDGWRDDPGYALDCLRAAAGAGAENLTLCDTNGASLPAAVADAVRDVVGALDTPIGIHCHNDAECGAANSLAAVAEGAMLVQGTMNGYGERCGNANLTSIVPSLQLKLGHDCLPTLEGWTEAAHYLDELLNLSPNPNQPYVGKNAFAHKGGMHVAGVNADPATFEHIDPAAVGNSREVLVSELSGKGTVIAHAGGALDDAAAARVVERVKELEHRGFQFEAADGSFDLLIRRETGDYEPLFRLESWRVISEKREDGRVQTEATIKIWVPPTLDGQRYVATAEGNGPVHALDRALREAIGEHYPHLRDIKLVNYKVRILDEWKATGATTRVLLDATDGTDTWGAIGVHENVIEASWDALVDSLEAGMVRTRAAPGV